MTVECWSSEWSEKDVIDNETMYRPQGDMAPWLDHLYEEKRMPSIMKQYIDHKGTRQCDCWSSEWREKDVMDDEAMYRPLGDTAPWFDHLNEEKRMSWIMINEAMYRPQGDTAPWLDHLYEEKRISWIMKQQIDHKGTRHHDLIVCYEGKRQ